MGAFDILPNADFRNDGWTVAGINVTNVATAVNNDDDTKFVQSPPSKGVAAVAFPVDTSELPDGAVIDSVSVYVRSGKTTVEIRKLTVQTSAADDPSRFTSRVIYVQSGPTTVEVATYRRDVLGQFWDRHRVNKIIIRILSVNGSVSIRIYKIFVRIRYRLRPVVTIVQPSGTILTPSPTITWTYSQANGDPQKKAEYKIYTADEVALSNFNPDTTVATFHRTVTGDVLSDMLPTSLNPDNYYIYLRAYSSFNAKSQWKNRQFTIAGPAPAPPGNDNAGVAGTPGVGVITVIPDSFRSSATLTMRDASNLLSVQQADFETASDPLEYTTSNCTIARSTSEAFGVGDSSMSMTASSAADMTATSTFVEVAPDTPVTVRVQFKTAVTARSVSAQVLFFDESFASAGGTITGAGTDAAGTWTEVTDTGTVPSAARYAKVALKVTNPASAEVHRVDAVGLMYGTGSAWSHGGHMSRNLLDAFSSTADEPSNATYGWIAGNAACSIARPSTSGTGSHGLLTNQLTYDGLSPTIAFRATSATFNSVTNGTDFTLNKPAGVAEDDLMLAFVTSSEHGSVTPPVGWETVNTASVNNGSNDIALWVLKRTAGGSEPSTWTDGALSAASTRRSAVVVAYSGAADAADQMVAEGVRTDTDGALTHTTTTVSNTASNAWRIAAFAARDNATGTTMTANQQPPGGTLPVSFIGTAANWGTSSDTSSFTVNRPSGIVSGDLMLATVGVADDACTFTPPSGWTLVRQGTQTDSVAPVSYAVMWRTAGSSEPPSWAGTLSGSRSPVMTQCQAYRNVHATTPFIAENVSVDPSGTQIATASVTNTNSSAWRVCSFLFSVPDDSGGTVTSTETKERKDNYQWKSVPGFNNDRTITIQTADSNATVSTGSHSRVATLSRSFYAAASWIGFLNPLVTPPSFPDETERTDFTAGTADPWTTLAVYDSNGVAVSGSMSVTGTITPGSGTAIDAVASWIGVIRPAAIATAGTVEAQLNSKIELEDMDQSLLSLAGNQVTFSAAFLGSTSGTPYLKLGFYRANELLLESTEEGSTFGTSVWAKSYATFDVPEGTTRVLPELSATGRAIGDTVSFDRVSVSLGDSPVWRNGTGRDAHPVWSIPDIQYADDDGTGYGEWQTLPGLSVNPPHYDQLTGALVYEDHTMVPLNVRKYRAQTISHGLNGDHFASGYGPESADVILEAANWWLKDITDPDSNMMLRVRRELSVGTTNTSSVFQPLGEDYPVVVTEGYKGDAVDITVLVNHEEHVQLRELIRRGKTLYLQTDMDSAWWVRPVGDLGSELLPTSKRQSNPLRWVKLTFVQVAAEL